MNEENDFISTKRFFNIANENRCCDNVTYYGDKFNCCGNNSYYSKM